MLNVYLKYDHRIRFIIIGTTSSKEATRVGEGQHRAATLSEVECDQWCSGGATELAG